MSCCVTMVDANGDPVVYTLNAGGSWVGTNLNGGPVVSPVALANATGCTVSVTAGGSFTGAPSGVFVDGCQIVPMPAGGDPETVHSAGLFPEGWRQLFTVPGGETEGWAVVADSGGVKEWRLMV